MDRKVLLEVGQRSRYLKLKQKSREWRTQTRNTKNIQFFSPFKKIGKVFEGEKAYS